MITRGVVTFLSIAAIPLAVSAQQEHTLPQPAAPPPVAGARAKPIRGQYVDFANFGRYAVANEKLGDPGDNVARVVFMGDSITDTWGQHFATAFPGKPYVGRGISGQTTPQMLLRFHQDVINLKPAVVVILAGINDIAENTGPETDEQIEGNLQAMTVLAQSAHIRVVLSSILPAAYFPWRPAINPTTRVIRLNTWLRAFAARTNSVYLDYYSAMATSAGALNPELAEDKFIHPNSAGYKVMQPLAEAAIRVSLSHPVP